MAACPIPPFGPLDEERNCATLNEDAPQSVVLINATLRGRKFSPVSLPHRQSWNAHVRDGKSRGCRS
ncbi:MAG: hypothetical protein RR091_03420 [Cloacibacillus sp.]